jgi:hypothetical protein
MPLLSKRESAPVRGEPAAQFGFQCEDRQCGQFRRVYSRFGAKKAFTTEDTESTEKDKEEKGENTGQHSSISRTLPGLSVWGPGFTPPYIPPRKQGGP